jgi:hypothetical protein
MPTFADGNTCAEQSSNDDSPMYTVRYIVRAPTLLPLSGPLSQRAIIYNRCHQIFQENSYEGESAFYSTLPSTQHVNHPTETYPSQQLAAGNKALSPKFRT